VHRLLGISLLAATDDAAGAKVELLEAFGLDPTDCEAFEAVRNLGG